MSGRAIAFSIVIAGVLLAMVYPLYKAAQVSNYSSPTIRKLAQDLSKGRDEAEAEFWARVEADGAPMVELPKKAGEAGMLTFVYRGDEATERVELVGPIAETITDRRDLERLGKSSVWFRTYDAPLDFRAAYRLLVNGAEGATDGGIRDPFNVVADGDNSVAAMPDAVDPVWIERTPPAPAGTYDEFPLQSRYLNTMRTVTVYLPPGYGEDLDQRYPLLITFDGTMYRDDVPGPIIQNNLLADGAIRPFVHVMLETPPVTRMTELGFNDALVGAVCQELLPLLYARYAISTDAQDVAIGGASLGGLAAAYVGVSRPDLFQNVIAQSGVFRTWRGPDEATDSMAAVYANAPAVPSRMYLDSGTEEEPTIAENVRKFREAAVARSIVVRYGEFDGGHDAKGWRTSFGDALRFIFAP